jgi:hypothetical protein
VNLDDKMLQTCQLTVAKQGLRIFSASSKTAAAMNLGSSIWLG